MVKEKAELEMLVLNGEANRFDKLNIFTDFINKGLPQEIITRLDSLWNMTKTISGEIVNVGRIILVKIWEFVQENTNLTIGVAIGVAIGSLVSLVPFLGSFLAPIGMALGALIGGVTGERLDRIAKGEMVSEKSGMIEGSIMVAKKFFKLLADIFNALKSEF